MRKRERENPCGICGHYHKYEEGEVCGVCGHRMPVVADKSASSSFHVSAFPSEILPEFLYLGSYDNAARAELLKSQGISRVLNVKRFSFSVYFISLGVEASIFVDFVCFTQILLFKSLWTYIRTGYGIPENMADESDELKTSPEFMLSPGYL